MDLRDLLALLYRQWLTLTAITLAVVIATVTITLQQPEQQQITLLYSVGISETDSANNSFDLTKIGDDFAKTVAGWWRSPALSDRISSLSSEVVVASATPQAKQNFLLELNFTDSTNAEKIQTAAIKVLNEELARYNTQSKYSFFVTLHGATTISKDTTIVTLILAALLGGLLLAVGWILLYAYFGGRISSAYEAEQILDTTAALTFHKVNDPALAFLDVLLMKIGRHAVLAGADVSVKKIEAKLGTRTTTAEIPREAAVFSREHLALIVVVRLDTTRLATLRQIRAATDGKIQLIIWG